MKSYKELVKKYKASEMAESYVFPNELNKLEREQSLESFGEWRKKDKSKQTVETKLKIQLMQLKFLMEDYIKETGYRKEYDFSYFLKEYIIRLGKKHKEFAEEMNIDPTELSQIINKHRQPNEKFIIRLEIHSNKNFPAIIWYNLIQKEKTFELLTDQTLRNTERKHVKRKLSFTI